MFPLPIATGFYQSEILPFSAQRCVNWIPIKAERGALNDRALLDRPGLTQFATLSGEFRCDAVFQNKYITLNGTTLSEISSTGTVTTKGTIGGSGRVSIAVNEDYAVFVNNLGEGFYYDGSTVTQITDNDFLDASTVCYVDGYFIFSEKDGYRFFLSDVNDPSSYSALDRSTAEERPDKIVAVFNYNNRLHVAGTETLEKFNNVGGVSFPFVRINGATNSVGCFSKLTPIEVENSFAFIGGGKNEGAQVYLLTGGNAQAISTTAVDNQLQRFTEAELENAYSLVYQKNGQHLVLFTVESDREENGVAIKGITIGVNLTSNEWLEFSSDNGVFRGRSITKIYNKFMVGDDENKVGYLDSDARTDYGETIFREKASQPFISQDGEEFRVGCLEAWFQAGTGNGTTSPQVMMDFTDDLGRTWETETWRGLGKVGKYGRRVQWRKQGLCTRNRVYRFKASDPYLFNFMKLTFK